MTISIILILLIGIIVLSTFSLIKQKGAKPSGKRLERIEKSVLYANGIFQNTQDPKMDKIPFEGIKEMLKKGIDRTPSKVIETRKLDLERFINSGSDETLIAWLGHSSFLLKMNGVVILVDPVLSERASMFRFLGPKKFNYSCDYAVDDLPEIDLVLLSHDHYDHLDYHVINALKNKVGMFVTPLGVGAHLEYWGVDSSKIKEAEWWDTISFGNIEFTATPGLHFTGRFTDRFKTLWCGWAMKSTTNNIYYSGDSGYFDGFKEIGEKLGPFDFALMECGQYSKYWPMIHMMPEESVQAALDVNTKVAMPIHWGKFKLSIHAWYESPNRFLAKANEEKLEVSIPKIGQVFSIDEKPLDLWWKP